MGPIASSTAGAATDCLWHTACAAGSALWRLAQAVYAFVRNIFASLFARAPEASTDRSAAPASAPEEDFIIIEGPEVLAAQADIDLDHLKERAPIPEPPPANPQDLLEIFENWIIDPSAELRQGFEVFVKHSGDNEEIHKLAKHMVHLLSHEACDAEKRRSCLSELALAGAKADRGEKTAIIESARICYALLSGEGAAAESVYSLLRGMRASILESAGTAIAEKSALVALGSLHLPVMWVPLFFQAYNKREIISHILKTVNGEASGPWFALPFSIGRHVVLEWLSSNFSADDIFEKGSKMVKYEAIEAFLLRIRILRK